MPEPLRLPHDRYFSPDPAQKRIALELYDSVARLPIVSPHGHVDPALLAGDNAVFGSPADLFIIPDHYVFRLLYSRGIPMESLGVPRVDGGEVETDHRKIWDLFARNFHLFRGTPTGMWLAHELESVFGIRVKLTAETGPQIYDEIVARLAAPEFRPRALFQRFNIEVLCTTDAAADPLDSHKAIRHSGWSGCVRPTFRPDAVVNLAGRAWRSNIEQLEAACGITIRSYAAFIAALEQRRAYFKEMGATATDHGAETAFTGRLSASEADAIFRRAIDGRSSPGDARLFSGHMLLEMARMSVEDGLVMQLHVGSFRNHNDQVMSQFGENKGADIPVSSEFTRDLHPLLNRYGNDPKLRLVLFTLDESTYSRELAPLAGHYPAVVLGPPWWFHDSFNGMRRYLDLVMESAGIYNTAGFNDDTRAFPSIPARHDLWRRASADWLAGLVVRSVIDDHEGHDLAHEMAYGLAKRTYNL